MASVSSDNATVEGGDPLANATDEEIAEYKRAVAILQKAIRGRKLRQLWPNMEQLRARYLDPKALAAGASDSPWYSNFALACREGLRYAPQVVRGLNDTWNTLTAAAGTPTLSKEDYTTMMRKLYLAVKIDESDHDIDPKDCLDSLEEDWIEDSDGKDELTESAFHRCFFQLVDMNCDALGADEYVACSYIVSHRLHLPSRPTIPHHPPHLPSSPYDVPYDLGAISV